MAEYIFKPENDSSTLTSGIENMCALMPKDWYGTIHGQIIRCCDCEYYGNGGVDDGYCYYWNTCDFGDCIHDSDDFCSRGSRKEA